MKKFIAFLALPIIVLFTFTSCELDDNSPNYRFELVPIVSAELPESFVLGQTYPIKVFYERPTTCHFYEGFYFERNLNTRIIGVQTSVVNNSNCQDIEDGEPMEAKFNFTVTGNGSYIFKFYQGKDAQGNNIFLEYEVPVVAQ